MPANRRRSGRGGDRRYRLADHLALVRLGHLGLSLPAPAVGAHLVAIGCRLGREPWRRGDRAAAGIDGRLDAVALEQRPDARPTRPRAIGEMALHTGIRHAVDPLDDFVDILVALVLTRE